MPQTWLRFLLLVVMLFGLLALPSGQSGKAETEAVSAVTLVSPSACPPNGCAAGQRLNYRVDFNVTKIDPSRSPNLQVCFYFPGNWSVTQVTASSSSLNLTYNSGFSACDSAPSNYNYSGLVANVQTASASESLNFAFRLGSSASTNGQVIVRIFELDTTNAWSKAGEGTSSSLSVTATSANVYVANDAAACSTFTPCYINSGDDQNNGFGTGLKDAIDGAASSATITVLGTYTLKDNQVLVDKPYTLKSSESGKISYIDTVPVCTQPMLMVTAGANINGLTLDDGSCASTTTTTYADRNLIVVSSSNPVTIESSDLTGGLDGVHVTSSNSAALLMRYNQITNNSGWAVYLDSSNTGVLNAYANNFFGNKSGTQVECNGTAKGNVDHNFWGTGLTVSQGVSNCAASDAKRLGARVFHNSSGAGVQAQRVTVGTGSVQYAFNNTVGYQRTGTGNDVGLVIVNHSYGSAENIPFTAGQLGNLTVCSNFWDVFITDSSLPASPATLDLYFKYNLTAGCTATIESSQFCGQTLDNKLYPLYWFNLSANDWGTTGTGGQTTSCRTDSNKDIKVTIDFDTANHPNFNDLSRLPFVVALPGQIVVTNVTVFPGSEQATLHWTTAAEANVTGFVVQRSEEETGPFADVSDLIPRVGSSTTGSTYQYTDTDLTDYTTYYYRLRISYSNTSTPTFTSAVSVMPYPATPTPTLVPSRTTFPTSTFIYKSPTATFTPTPTPTSPFKTITITGTATSTSLTRTPNTATATLVATTQLPATALAQTRIARTEIARLSETPTFTLTPTPIPVSQQAEPLTVAMAVLAAGTLAGGAFFLIREQRHFHE
jgi:hypothetical protein